MAPKRRKPNAQPADRHFTLQTLTRPPVEEDFHLHSYGKWYDVRPTVLTAYPEVLHFVVRTPPDLAIRDSEAIVTLEAGVSLRHPAGIYSARRFGQDLMHKHPEFSPRHAGQRHSPRHDYLYERGRLIALVSTEIIDTIDELVARVRQWAIIARKTGDKSDGSLFVDQLKAAMVRPYRRFCHRMVEALLACEPDSVIAYCDLLTVRTGMEATASTLSHTLHFVEHHKPKWRHLKKKEERELHERNLLNAACLPTEREQLAGQIRASEHKFSQLTPEIGVRLAVNSVSAKLIACAKKLEAGDVKAAKKHLDEAFDYYEDLV